MVYELQETDENRNVITIQAGDILVIKISGKVNINPDDLDKECDKWTDIDGIPGS